MGFLIVVLGVSMALTLMAKDRWQQGNRVDLGVFLSTFGRFAGIIVVLAIVVVGSLNSLVIVPAGHRGIVFNRLKGLRPAALGEGFNMVMPIVEQVYLMDVRVQKDSHDASAASKDMQMVHTKVALNFHPQPEAVAQIFQEVGMGFSERIIQPSIQEAVKATTARFTAEELVTRREEVKNLIRDLVEKQVSPFHIKVDELYITDFDFSKQFAEAIETKQIAEQQALKAKRDLDRIKIEADQKIASARAEAESLRMQKEAITPQLIELRKVETQNRAIDKWNGVMPSVILGGGSTPLIDLNGFTPKR